MTQHQPQSNMFIQRRDIRRQPFYFNEDPFSPPPPPIPPLPSPQDLYPDRHFQCDPNICHEKRAALLPIPPACFPPLILQARGSASSYSTSSSLNRTDSFSPVIEELQRFHLERTNSGMDRGAGYPEFFRYPYYHQRSFDTERSSTTSGIGSGSIVSDRTSPNRTTPSIERNFQNLSLRGSWTHDIPPRTYAASPHRKRSQSMLNVSQSASSSRKSSHESPVAANSTKRISSNHHPTVCQSHSMDGNMPRRRKSIDYSIEVKPSSYFGPLQVKDADSQQVLNAAFDFVQRKRSRSMTDRELQRQLQELDVMHQASTCFDEEDDEEEAKVTHQPRRPDPKRDDLARRRFPPRSSSVPQRLSVPASDVSNRSSSNASPHYPSYLLLNELFIPPARAVHQPHLTLSEPDPASDDVLYRTIRDKNTIPLQPPDPQPPFGIPLHPVIPALKGRTRYDCTPQQRILEMCGRPLRKQYFARHPVPLPRTKTLLSRMGRNR